MSRVRWRRFTSHPSPLPAFKNIMVIYSLGFYFGMGWQLSWVLDQTEEVVWVESLLMLKLL